jgi:hypothetical protein
VRVTFPAARRAVVAAVAVLVVSGALVVITVGIGLLRETRHLAEASREQSASNYALIQQLQTINIRSDKRLREEVDRLLRLVRKNDRASRRALAELLSRTFQNIVNEFNEFSTTIIRRLPASQNPEPMPGCEQLPNGNCKPGP